MAYNDISDFDFVVVGVYMTSMQSLFPEYCPLDEDETKALWGNCIFVFDTNILLNLYRYQPDTVSEFFLVCDKISDRLWMPYQVCKEFMKNRPKVVTEQVSTIDKYISVIDSLSKSSATECSKISPRLHSVVNIEEISQEIQDKFKVIKGRLNDVKNMFDGSVHESLLGDTVISRLERLFQDKINKKPDNIDEKIRDALARYKKNIPPGYEDAKSKDDIDSCGDCLIWFEILEKAKECKCSIIFISDDRKEDWVWKVNGRRLWCRPELIKEFSVSAPEQVFYLYDMARFFEISRQNIKVSIKASSIEDITRVATEQRTSTNCCDAFVIDLFSLVSDTFANILSKDDESRVYTLISRMRRVLSENDLLSPTRMKSILNNFLDLLLSNPSMNKISRGRIENFLSSIDKLVDRYANKAMLRSSELHNVDFNLINNENIISYNDY